MRIGRKGKAFALLERMLISIATMENNMEIPQKNKNETIVQCSNLTSEHFPKKDKTLIQRRYSKGTLLFIASLFTMGATEVSINQ